MPLGKGVTEGSSTPTTAKNIQVGATRPTAHSLENRAASSVVSAGGEEREEGTGTHAVVRVVRLTAQPTGAAALVPQMVCARTRVESASAVLQSAAALGASDGPRLDKGIAQGGVRRGRKPAPLAIIVRSGIRRAEGVL